MRHAHISRMARPAPFINGFAWPSPFCRTRVPGGNGRSNIACTAACRRTAHGPTPRAPDPATRVPARGRNTPRGWRRCGILLNCRAFWRSSRCGPGCFPARKARNSPPAWRKRTRLRRSGRRCPFPLPPPGSPAPVRLQDPSAQPDAFLGTGVSPDSRDHDLAGHLNCAVLS